MRRTSIVSRFALVAVSVGVTIGLVAGPGAAQAGKKYPVPYTFAANIAAAVLEPGTPPPGSNDWSCRPTAAHPHPVVLVHGLFANMTDNWQTMSPLLANNGYCVFALTYGNDAGASAPLDEVGGLAPMEQSAVELRAFVNRVLAATGARKVDIVGHSEGATMPDYYIEYLGGAAKVARYVGVSGVKHGTTLHGIGTLVTEFASLFPQLAPAAVGPSGRFSPWVLGSEIKTRARARAAAPGFAYTNPPTHTAWGAPPTTASSSAGRTPTPPPTTTASSISAIISRSPQAPPPARAHLGPRPPPPRNHPPRPRGGGGGGGGEISSRCSPGRALEGTADLEPDRADLDREHAVARVQRRDASLERGFGFSSGAQDRDRTAFSAGPVDLPSERSMRRRDLDDPSRVRADKSRVQGILRLGVGDHRLTEGLEIPREDGVAGLDGRGSQPRKHLRPACSHLLDHLAMHVRRIMGRPRKTSVSRAPSSSQTGKDCTVAFGYRSISR